MATRLIELENSFLLKAEVPEDEAQPISTNVIKGVKFAFAQVKPILIAISRSIAEAGE